MEILVDLLESLTPSQWNAPSLCAGWRVRDVVSHVLMPYELTTPRFPPLRALYLFYFRRILPAVGRMVSKHMDAYTYLPESVLAFPEPDALARRLTAAGFSRVGYDLLTGGICAIHHGLR